MPIKADREYRDLCFEIRKAESEQEKSYIVEGYATTWERYELYEGVFEQFSADCFRNADMSDVIFQYNHDGKVFARQSNGTLELTLDDIGLKVRADLGKSASAREMFEEIDSGLVTKMSWGFMPNEYHFDRKTQTIIHDSVKKVFDVSAVSIPANNTTSICSMRDFVNGENDKALKEFQEHERKIKALELKIKLANI